MLHWCVDMSCVSSLRAAWERCGLSANLGNSVIYIMQKQVSDLKVENQNLKRLLLRQGSSRAVRDGLRSSMSFRDRGHSAIHSPDFRFSLAESSSSSCDVPATKLSLKYSLTDLNSSDGQWYRHVTCCQSDYFWYFIVKKLGDCSWFAWFNTILICYI